MELDGASRARRILETSPIFAGLPEASLRPLYGQSVVHRYDGRKTLFRSGDSASWVGVVGAGRVRLTRRAPGRELTLDYRGPGELVGEGALLEGAYRADASAVERAEVLHMPLDLMQTLFSREPSLAQRVLRAFASRNHALESRLEALLTRSVESRIAEFLVQLGQQHGVTDSRGVLLGVRFTHQEIANYVGATRETVTLVLGELRRRGLIEMAQRRIVILDMHGLGARV